MNRVQSSVHVLFINHACAVDKIVRILSNLNGYTTLVVQGKGVTLHYTAYNYLRPQVKIKSTVNLEYFP